MTEKIAIVVSIAIPAALTIAVCAYREYLWWKREGDKFKAAKEK